MAKWLVERVSKTGKNDVAKIGDSQKEYDKHSKKGKESKREKEKRDRCMDKGREKEIKEYNLRHNLQLQIHE